MLPDDPQWYKDAIIYQLHVKSFCDSDGDGKGDFRGLTSKLDYIQQLGVTAIWLLPFYPSPQRDDGYDIADYHGVHQDYGTLDDFCAFVGEAHARGLRVITELVINHTSDQHAWFQAARAAPVGSPERDFYVWSDTDDRYPETRIIFTDTEASNWTWDPVAGAYYWHRFFSHQPDLNHNNPRVTEAVIRVMEHWLDTGVDGLRLDAIPYLCVREGTNNENLPETHAVIRRLRQAVDERFPGRLLLAEANQWPEDVVHYFGDGDECHMAYHFPVMPRLYMAVAQQDRRPITEIMDQTPAIPDDCQWAMFLRNHDELTLEMVTDGEREVMYDHYASDPRMRCNVGIRRRLAPLMDNHRRKIELLNSLLLSFPGTPFIYYGDELGMGDDISQNDRDGVRTPMQWSGDRNGGFSGADPAQLYLPAIDDPVYGYQAVNVEAQRGCPASRLNWMKRLMAVRQRHRAFGRGSVQFLRPRNHRILAYLRQHEDEEILCVANLAHTAQPVELDLAALAGRIPVELSAGPTPFPRIGQRPYLLTLPGHGFYWFLLAADEQEAGGTFEDSLAARELSVLVLADGWSGLLAPKPRQRLCQQVLPRHLPTRRWFGAKGRAMESVELTGQLVWGGGEDEPEQGDGWWLVLLRVRLDGGEMQRYFLPLAVAWDEAADALLAERPDCVVAKVRQVARVGVCYDALADARFCQRLVQAMERGETVPLWGGQLRGFSVVEGEQGDQDEVRFLAVEQSNTSAVLGERRILKGLRLVQPGQNPELELGRFLTEVARYPNTPRVEGGLVVADREQGDLVLAILQSYVPNQGDGWNFTLDYLERFLDQPGRPDSEAADGEHASYLAWARTLGRRTGQLHRALTPAAGGDPAFDPEPVTTQDLSNWRSTVARDAEATLDTLGRRLSGLEVEGQRLARRLLDARDRLAGLLDELAPESLDTVKVRFHGDLHLGQVLVQGDDVQIIDFEGERPRPDGLRVDKHSPLRDVAGMLRSLDYAAHAALARVAADGPRPQEAATRLRRWQELASAAFMEGYEQGVGACACHPADERQARRLKDLFVLEKALYEVNYELNYRPAWVEIPLRGILAILESR